MLRQLGATVVHSNGLKAHVSAALAKPAGVRLVWHLHEYVAVAAADGDAAAAAGAARRRRSSRTPTACRQDAAAVLGAGRDAAADPQRRRSGGRFAPKVRRSTWPALAGLPGDDGLVRIGLVSTFARWKGHEMFVDAIAPAARALARPRLHHRRRGLRDRRQPVVDGRTAGRCRRRADSRTWSASPATSTTCPPRCARSTSSFTRARRRSHSGW